LTLYQDYFLENQDTIIAALVGATSRDDIDSLADRIRTDIVKAYGEAQFHTPVDISPYNRVRKIVDLYLEHAVALARELATARRRLIPFMFLPLDSKIFGNQAIFTDQELAHCKLNRRSFYGSLKRACPEFCGSRVLVV